MHRIVIASELLKIAKELTAIEFNKEARIAERVAKSVVAWGYRRTVSGDPYWITVKYPGHCHKCHAPIERGEQAFFYPKGRYLFGDKCGHGKEAEGDFLTHSEMDVFDN
jgi:hypothetical protein